VQGGRGGHRDVAIRQAGREGADSGVDDGSHQAQHPYHDSTLPTGPMIHGKGEDRKAVDVRLHVYDIVTRTYDACHGKSDGRGWGAHFRQV